jgi:hypothetical protein
MTHSNEKRLFNRFDQYEVASIFTQSAEEFLSKRFKTSWRRFILKCIICILLAVNGYLVQWGPFSLPSGYYFVLFSVIFYHLGSWIYERLNDDKGGDVSLVVISRCRLAITSWVARSTRSACGRGRTSRTSSWKW